MYNQTTSNNEIDDDEGDEDNTPLAQRFSRITPKEVSNKRQKSGDSDLNQPIENNQLNDHQSDYHASPMSFRLLRYRFMVGPKPGWEDVDEFLGRMRAFDFQLHLDYRIHGPGVRGVSRRPVR